MPPSGVKVIATNRQARRDYEVLETVEAGLVLRGSEVKSLREAHVQFADANGWIRDGEAWLLGLHIAPYSHAQGAYSHDPDRERKLLLRHHEIRLAQERTRHGDELESVVHRVLDRGAFVDAAEKDQGHLQRRTKSHRRIAEVRLLERIAAQKPLADDLERGTHPRFERLCHFRDRRVAAEQVHRVEQRSSAGELQRVETTVALE